VVSSSSSFRLIINEKDFILFVYLRCLVVDNGMIPVYGMEHLFTAHATVLIPQPIAWEGKWWRFNVYATYGDISVIASWLWHSY